ncbi:hypothetical protein ACFUC1_04575 [Pedococcus sp. NPDC057267]|uniref:hypothetical protein n=1 Tax=Pedococcus sp. NPDC057267 TaxID=3346077 RepID=UPI003626F2D1
MGSSLLGGLLVAVAVTAASLWVLQDARSRARLRRPVVATLGGLTVDRPEVWATLCLLVVVVFLPLYLTARRAD